MFVSLVRSEVRRLLSRRFLRALAGLVIVVIVAIAVGSFVQSSKDPGAGLARARERVAQCERDQVAVPGKFEPTFRCPTIDQALTEFDRRFRYAETIPDAQRGVAMALMAIGFIIGASFVGADWSGGSMTTLLTWEPRRGRLLAARAIAAAAVVAVFAASVLIFVAVVFLPVGALRGTTEGLDAGLWRAMSGVWARGAGLAAFGSLVAVGLATIFRNTAGALGTGFFYGAILDPLLGALWSARFRIWTLQHLAPRLVGLAVEDHRDAPTLGIGRPVVLLSLYAAAVLALAYGTFRRRDVT